MEVRKSLFFSAKIHHFNSLELSISVIACNVDAVKQFGGQAVLGHPSLHQPVGDSVATAAASVMAGALGAAQTASIPNQTGLQNLSLLGTDPLTRHLAKLSRSQLTEVLAEFKVRL